MNCYLYKKKEIHNFTNNLNICAFRLPIDPEFYELGIHARSIDL